MTQLFYSGAGAPSTAPAKAQRFYIDTLNREIYTSVGTSSSADWILSTGRAGADGVNGVDGVDGIGIASIVRTSGTGAAGSTDTYTITYSDATTSTFTVVNGSNGMNGTNGTNGVDGTNGTNGTNGVSILWQGTLSAAPSTPSLNWAYYNSIDKKSYIWDGDSWEILAQDGVDGAGGGSFDLPAAIHAATSKATPVDADELPIADSEASFALKNLTLVNLYNYLKAKFDTLYPAIARGLPSGGTTGQVLTKSSGTDYDVAWNTPSGGGGSLEIGCFTWTYLYASSTRLTISSIYTAYQGISGSSTSTNRLTLPVGVYLVDVWYEQVIVGRLNDVLTFVRLSGGTLSVVKAIVSQAGTAAATSTTTTNAFQKLRLTVTGSAVAGYICGVSADGEIAIASGTASTQALVVATFTKVS